MKIITRHDLLEILEKTLNRFEMTNIHIMQSFNPD